MTHVIASGIAFVASVASGFFGIGGGIIIIPSLIFLPHMTQTQAVASDEIRIVFFDDRTMEVYKSALGVAAPQN